jgi:hypothetical protein
MRGTETTTVRISTRTHQVLRELAAQRSEALQDVIDEAAELLRRESFFMQLRQACASLSKRELDEERAEAKAWDATLADGLAKE